MRRSWVRGASNIFVSMMSILVLLILLGIFLRFVARYAPTPVNNAATWAARTGDIGNVT